VTIPDRTTSIVYACSAHTANCCHAATTSPRVFARRVQSARPTDIHFAQQNIVTDTQNRKHARQRYHCPTFTCGTNGGAGTSVGQRRNPFSYKSVGRTVRRVLPQTSTALLAMLVPKERTNTLSVLTLAQGDKMSLPAASIQLVSCSRQPTTCSADRRESDPTTKHGRLSPPRAAADSWRRNR
jgi:hypothetical protein